MHPIFSRPRVHKKGSSMLKGGKREGGRKPARRENAHWSLETVLSKSRCLA